jgi:putative tricarboxylic transport membrane protein
VYWISAGKLPEKSVVFPKFVTVVLIPLFIWVFIQSIVEYQRLAKNTEIPEKEKWDFTLKVSRPKLVITAATAVYILLIPIIGYIVTSILYIGGLSFYLGNRKPVKLILYTLVFFSILYGIFVVLMRVRVPSGILF